MPYTKLRNKFPQRAPNLPLEGGLSTGSLSGLTVVHIRKAPHIGAF